MTLFGLKAQLAEVREARDMLDALLARCGLVQIPGIRARVVMASGAMGDVESDIEDAILAMEKEEQTK